MPQVTLARRPSPAPQVEREGAMGAGQRVEWRYERRGAARRAVRAPESDQSNPEMLRLPEPCEGAAMVLIRAREDNRPQFFGLVPS